MIGLFFTLFLSLNEVVESPETYKNQQIEIKGYLYRDENKQVILSDTPGLRSCCFGKEEIRQIRLSGKFPEELPVQPATVTGYINSLGKPSLEDAKIVSSPSSYGLLVLLGVPLAILAGLFLKKHR